MYEDILIGEDPLDPRNGRAGNVQASGVRLTGFV